jgi:hypothetical protein
MMNVMIITTITYLTTLLVVSLQGIDLLVIVDIHLSPNPRLKNSNSTIVMFAKMEGSPPQN